MAYHVRIDVDIISQHLFPDFVALSAGEENDASCGWTWDVDGGRERTKRLLSFPTHPTRDIRLSMTSVDECWHSVLSPFHTRRQTKHSTNPC